MLKWFVAAQTYECLGGAQRTETRGSGGVRSAGQTRLVSERQSHTVAQTVATSERRRGCEESGFTELRDGNGEPRLTPRIQRAHL